MAQTFVLKDILRHTNPSLVTEYCRRNNIPFELKNKEDEDETVNRFETIFNGLSREQQGQVESDFQEINDLCPNASIAMLIQEAKDSGQPLPTEDLGKMSEHDSAFWFYLNQTQTFDKVSILWEVNETLGWKEVYAGQVSLVKVSGKSEMLKRALSVYLMETDLKGKNCKVEEYVRDGGICYVAYPEDYARADVRYDDNNSLRKKEVRKPVFKIYFVYNPEEGRLRVKAGGGTEKIKAYQKIFMATVLEDKSDPVNDRIFDLDKLKDKNLIFSYEPEDHVEYVLIKTLRLKYFDGGKRITLDYGDGRGLADLHDWIESLHIPLDMVHITQAIIIVKFKPTIKRSSGKVTVQLSFPNSQNLADKPLHNKVRELLRRWGIDRNRDEAII